MKTLSCKYFPHLPYLIIQPCMMNRRENKVVLLNGEATYIASISTGSNKRSSGGTNKQFGDYDSLLQFANEAVRRFVTNVPFAIIDGLFRVDIFQTQEGRLVVNEFESLEANYSSKKEDMQFRTYDFLIKYWENMIGRCLNLKM